MQGQDGTLILSAPFTLLNTCLFTERKWNKDALVRFTGSVCLSSASGT